MRTRELPRQAEISWWMEEARADPSFEAGPRQLRPALTTDTVADVVVMGGGYTGMWTAWFLKQLAPGLDVVLLESEFCGSGPSGRNGGFLYGLWAELGSMSRMYGDEAALRLARVSHRSVGDIGRWLEEHDVDAWFVAKGHVTVSSAPAQDDAWQGMVAEAKRLGVPERFVDLSADDVQRVCRSPVFRAGVIEPENATVQPARLALGLRRELIRAGVRIYENSPVSRISEGPPVRVETATGGSVRAGQGVLGLGAWTSSLKRFHRVIVPRGTYMVVTEPRPDKLEDVGWTGGEGLSDFRTSLRYFRTTADGRIAFGAAAATAGIGTGLGPRLRYDADSIAKIAEAFRWMFPSWDDVRLEAAWGGPMDISGLHQPFFGSYPGGALHFGAGYAGGGVGPCHMGGQILARMCLGIQDEMTALPVVGAEPMKFPPEPLLSIGAALTQGAIVRKDDAEEQRERAGLITETLAKMPRRMGYEIGP